MGWPTYVQIPNRAGFDPSLFAPYSSWVLPRLWNPKKQNPPAGYFSGGGFLELSSLLLAVRVWRSRRHIRRTYNNYGAACLSVRQDSYRSLGTKISPLSVVSPAKSQCDSAFQSDFPVNQWLGWISSHALGFAHLHNASVVNRKNHRSKTDSPHSHC